jgi:precorrin-2/cobalt-factor-2 C20-methyltransferase
MARILCAGLGPGDPGPDLGPGGPGDPGGGAGRLFPQGGPQGAGAPDRDEGMLRPDVTEYAMEYPVTTELPFDSPDYITALARFYDDWADRLAALPGEVVVLCEGDPFFYGSFMHLYTRLQGPDRGRGDPRHPRHGRLLERHRRADDMGR